MTTGRSRRLDTTRMSVLVSLVVAASFSAGCGSDTTDNPGAGGSPSLPTGGTTTGGTTTGGTATGGTTTGGTTTGGTTTGGTATGGNASGGANAGAGGSGGVVNAGGGGAAAGSGGNSLGGSGGGAGAAGASGKGGGGAGGTAGAGGSGGSGGGAQATMNFFVTSDTSKTGNLGGIAKADQRCQTLAAAVGAGSKTWKAYLSTEEPLVNARDRIGPGPYYNAKGVELAADKDALHAINGNAELFLDEKGNRINGQWKGSPTPNEHDILTGTNEKGMLATGQTCDDWTGTSGMSAVGHSDGLGPSMNAASPYSRWVGSHTGNCSDTQPGGGAGRIYCFVGPP